MIESMIEMIRIFIILHRITLKLEFFAMTTFFSVIEIGAPSHGQTIQARNSNSFASCRKRFKLLLGVGLDNVR